MSLEATIKFIHFALESSRLGMIDLLVAYG